MGRDDELADEGGGTSLFVKSKVEVDGMYSRSGASPSSSNCSE
jgi:hypothetical protein